MEVIDIHRGKETHECSCDNFCVFLKVFFGLKVE